MTSHSYHMSQGISINFYTRVHRTCVYYTTQVLYSCTVRVYTVNRAHVLQTTVYMYMYVMYVCVHVCMSSMSCMYYVLLGVTAAN